MAVVDTSKLVKGIKQNSIPHDNCTVLDVGTGTFPRDIEVRPPGDDGARMNAIWDGSLDLEVNDIVLAIEYGQQTAWRIQSMGGADGGAGKHRVSKVWESDFGAVALQADATGQVGIGTATPATLLDINGSLTLSGGSQSQLVFGNGNELAIQGRTAGLSGIVSLYSNDGDGTDNITLSVFGVGTPGAVANRERAVLRFATGAQAMELFSEAQGTGTLRPLVLYTEGNADQLHLAANGRVGVGAGTPSGKLHVDQPSTTAAIPVAYFDQADISEEMFEFATTIGVGNAIEVVGSKLFTITHFIKNTLPGALTRYLPVGTIDTVGPKFTKSQTVTTQGLGANPDIFAFGFYESNTADANLTQASTTQTLGTANISYAAHAFAVTGGAGAVDTGVVGLRVNGTSINDQGTRTTSDTETIIADITAVSLNDYQETAKKWLGQVTFELFTVSGSPTTFSLDFNYGLAKYDDWFNADFTITDIEAVGFAGANDSNFDIKLMHHRSSGWTYSAAAFSPITAANTIASLVTDHSTDDQLLSSQHFSWKRDDLSEAIAGTGSEGYLIFISSSANNAIEYLNLHVGATF